MRARTLLQSAILTLFFFSSATAFSARFERWTYQELDTPKLPEILAELSRRSGWEFQASDFQSAEERPLAYSYYQRFNQVRGGIPIANAALRIWTSSDRQRALQVEAEIEDPSIKAPLILSQNLSALSRVLPRAELTIRSERSGLGKVPIRSEQRRRVWQGQRLVEMLRISTERGVLELSIDSLSGEVLKRSYRSHPQLDEQPDLEFAAPSIAYPVYEEYRNQLLTPVPVELRFIRKAVRLPATDPFASLRQQRYLESKLDETKGSTSAGQSEGYWSFNWLETTAERLRQDIPAQENAPGGTGFVLEGRFATISIHPKALETFGPWPFEPRFGEHLLYDWRELVESNDWEMVPMTSLRGRPWASLAEIAAPRLERHPTHDPRAYIAAGFDEVQVYYAVTAMFEALEPMGFKDPDLAERPFHAFLYNPDIEGRDNAFYTEDTINFTTYSPQSGNMARDNTTIWHELGHGVMDRLMGREIKLADTGGLSEGMADFVAELVLQAQTAGQPFPGSADQRIMNHTGFFLTNEVHDDGEAYGGAMKAILDSALARRGREGLVMVSDLILEAMRLSRDHPHLTAEDWFERVRFADQLGRPGLREAGELSEFIEAALNSRNFAAEADRASFSLKYAGQELNAGSPGTRDHEIHVNLDAEETASYELKATVRAGKKISLRYPLTVKISYDVWALQGAISWVNEAAGPLSFELEDAGTELAIPLGVQGRCDYVNRDGGACSDYAYVQVFEPDATQPVAKKRFYVRLTPVVATEELKPTPQM